MHSIFTSRRSQIIALLALMILIAVLVGMKLIFDGFTARAGGAPVADAAALPPPPPPPQVSLLDGQTFPHDQSTALVGVMIENHGASRPQMQGLPEASIVYEALAEGGITRFLAIFDRQDISKVGPVRSARSYYVDWAAEYGGAYVHAGGSPQALAQIPTEHLWNVDEGDSVLFRDHRYLAPHNLFLDLAGLQRELLASSWQPTLTIPRFDFSGRFPVDAVDATGVTFDFSFPNYRAGYVYDPASGTYERRLAGVIHRNAVGTPIRPTNIIVQFTSNWLLGDDDTHGRLGMQTTGSGTAWYFVGGKYFTGTWSKADGDVTQFLDSLSQPIALRPGQTWVEVIDSPQKVAVKRPVPVGAQP